MLDDDTTASSDGDGATDSAEGPPISPPRGRRAASRPAGPPRAAAAATGDTSAELPARPVKKAAKKPARTAAAKRTRTAKAVAPTEPSRDAEASVHAAAATDIAPADMTPADIAPTGAPATKRVRKAPGKRAKKAAESPPDAASPLFAAPTTSATAATTTRRRRTTAKQESDLAVDTADAAPSRGSDDPAEPVAAETTPPASADVGAGSAPLFRVPDPATARPSRRSTRVREAEDSQSDDRTDRSADSDEEPQTSDSDDDQGSRRRRRRGGRRRRKGGGDAGDSPSDRDEAADQQSASESDAPAPDKQSMSGKQGKPNKQSKSGPSDEDADDEVETSSSTRRRRRRRRKGESDAPSDDDPDNTVVKVRSGRSAADGITSVEGSTRLEAKKQRRREGRDAGRRRAPVLSEAEFLARRESVNREMVVRQRGDLIQIAVLEDNVLVEHYVARESQTSLIGNVYLARVQNVLPSMEAAFVDIGKGRNAVLYAGEVDWKSLGFDGKPRRIEDALSSGQSVLVQVTKDPIDHKGARLTGQISLPGRFLVYVPRGHTSGISRKLPDSERGRLKGLLKDILPDDAGVIVRTAAEGATEEQLTRDVTGLTARWEDIEKKSKAGQGPKLLYGEPDLMIKVVRDLFNEDFATLAVQGDEAWDNVDAYVKHVAPDLAERLERYQGDDVFSSHRVDEQIAKALDRKVYLPSGGSLVIDRTEAMTVVDVNTGKFTGSGGNLEETVTRNNLEAAEEVVRQLRLRDIGGIIVVDFIDMVLESNRDLVLRRLVECLGRDRTRHQVAEVTSLGLVQMTRKKIGTGLLEAFGQACEHCLGRGVIVHADPVEPKESGDRDAGRKGGRRRGGRSRSGGDERDDQGKDSGDSADKPATDDPVRADDTTTPAEQPVEAADDTPAKTPEPQVQPA